MLIVASSERSSTLFVCLASVFWASFADEDLAVKDAVGLAVEDALVQLMAIAMRLGVVDDGEAVDVLLVAAQVETVDRRLGAFAIEADSHLVANQSAAQGEIRRREISPAIEKHLRIRDVKGLGHSWRILQ